ncbi:hypothetical protein GBF38_005266 [Nibea albiflora]|uniref:Uncharacterized protein n=1 Tax=Nibea albiflora TaxID=240163 RepID=A0ACB7EV58_NIBAL|nr:hypothetical protein GBF38_005266 [Nibea albiflora]
MGKIYQVVVIGLRGERMTVDLCNTEEQMKSMTVGQLRKKIEEKVPTGVGDNAVRMIFTTEGLDDDSKLLSDYGIQQMSVIQLVIKVPGGLTA